MKKILALTLALCLVFVLCACGTGATPEVTSDSGTAASNSKTVDTETVAVGAVIIARDDVPEDEIYTLVKTIFENKDEISQMHAKGEELDIDVASSITSVPYHPGAAKYFKEKGIEVASVKEGAGKAGDNVPLTFGTGGESGTYYAYGGVLAQYVSANTDLAITAITSDASKTNVQEIDAGNDQIAFCQSDVMTYAYEGNKDRDFSSAVDSFSVVAALYPEQVQIVTTNPELATVADLEGKKVSIGASGSGTYFNAMDILGAYGLTEDDIDAKYQSFGDSADSLKDGKIDAAFIVAGAPTTAITDLATSGDVYLISMDEEHIATLLDSSPFYSASTIVAGTY
jgi:hypothetical protein